MGRGEQYRRATLEAVDLCRTQRMTPLAAWKAATAIQFPAIPGHRDFKTNKGYQTKRCPRRAFCGLCESGHVKGIIIPLGQSDKDNADKDYAIEAADSLLGQPLPTFQSAEEENTFVKELRVRFVPSKSNDHHMDVVFHCGRRNCCKKHEELHPKTRRIGTGFHVAVFMALGGFASAIVPCSPYGG